MKNIFWFLVLASMTTFVGLAGTELVTGKVSSYLEYQGLLNSKIPLNERSVAQDWTLVSRHERGSVNLSSRTKNGDSEFQLESINGDILLIKLQKDKIQFTAKGETFENKMVRVITTKKPFRVTLSNQTKSYAISGLESISIDLEPFDKEFKLGNFKLGK
ncbi:MAG: hypothetical protein ACRCXZ_08110 [Patescibacteria group bacterium]